VCNYKTPTVIPVTPPITPPVTPSKLTVAVTVDKTTAQTPMTVSFKNTTIGAVSHSWDFGNGIVSSLMSPTPQTYTKAGSYSVKYIATGSDGKTAIKTINLNATASSSDTGIVKPICTSLQTYNATTNTCVAGSGGSGGNTAKLACTGMNRGSAFDVTCALEKGNENYLYMAAGAVGLLALVLIMKNRG
jgi:PKD repeat protein